MNKRKLQKIPDIYKKIDQWTINQHEVLQRQSSLAVELQVLREVQQLIDQRQSSLAVELQVLREAQDRMLRTVTELSAWRSGTQETVVRHEKQLNHKKDKRSYLMYVSADYRDKIDKILMEHIESSKKSELEDFKKTTDIIFGEPKCTQCEEYELIITNLYTELLRRIESIKSMDHLSLEKIVKYLYEFQGQIQEKVFNRKS
jgi:hypothetical protein